MKTFTLDKVEGKIQVKVRTSKPIEYEERTFSLDALKNELVKIDESIAKLNARRKETVDFLAEIDIDVKKLK